MLDPLCSNIVENSLIPYTSFRRRLESCVIYPSTRGRHLGSGFRRTEEYTATGSIDAFDIESWRARELDNLPTAALL